MLDVGLNRAVNKVNYLAQIFHSYVAKIEEYLIMEIVNDNTNLTFVVPDTSISIV
jgi:hypothetical protein